ncbi:MAG: UDP-N-acetylglucosamine 1-carboxyvinyltransferase [Clostridia bacterium]
MSKYIINGGGVLDGQIKIKGAKNSILPLLAGSILTEGKVVLCDCPDISDIRSMLNILRNLGCKINQQGENIEIDSSNINKGEIPTNLARELRSSIFLLGALLSRTKKAKIAYPGGCDIGMRPIDIHLNGLRELNITVDEEGEYILCNSENAKCADIVFDLPSVGATENLMMASVFVKGTTVLRNCAKEPEIVDLQDFLCSMGAKIRGAGGSVIYIDGVDKLSGTEWTPIPDRIVAGSYIIATAICGGNIELENAKSEHISSLISKLAKTTCKINAKNDRITIRSHGRQKSIDCIETMYYPGFPTDLQTQMLTLQSISNGTSVIVENIFETRFRTVGELKKMGADIKVKDKVAIVKGVGRLCGANVTAYDLRGGASLVLAGLNAEGITIINDIYHIDRGYENMADILSAVGANIKRLD